MRRPGGSWLLSARPAGCQGIGRDGEPFAYRGHSLRAAGADTGLRRMLGYSREMMSPLTVSASRMACGPNNKGASW
jgi:hypothetical protein